MMYDCKYLLGPSNWISQKKQKLGLNLSEVSGCCRICKCLVNQLCVEECVCVCVSEV